MADRSAAPPLRGLRVLVTRPDHQAAEFSELLRHRSAEPLEVPMIRIVDPEDGGVALRAALSGLESYDWLVVTSPNGAARVAAHGGGVTGTGAVRVAAIGPTTVRVLDMAGIETDLMPGRYVAEGLLEAFPAPPPGGGRVLLARAADARSVLPDGLRALGWSVDDVACYQTVSAPVTDTQRSVIRQADVVTFTSASTVRHFGDLVGVAALPDTVACIGPATAAMAAELGISVDVQAREHTLVGLVTALEEYFAQ